MSVNCFIRPFSSFRGSFCAFFQRNVCEQVIKQIGSGFSKRVTAAGEEVRIARRINHLATESASVVVIEGDLIVYRLHSDKNWEIGAVTHTSGNVIELAAVHARDTDDFGRLEVFVDWHRFSEFVTTSLAAIAIAPLETDYEKRVITDRVSNPHGEESEDCWRVHPSELSTYSITIPVQT